MDRQLAELIERAKRAARDGDLGLADELYRACEGLSRASGKEDELAYVLRHRAQLALDAGDGKTALDAAREAVRLYRNGKPLDRLGIANALRLSALARETLEGVGAGSVDWLEARNLYAKCGVGEGVAECEAHLGGAL